MSDPDVHAAWRQMKMDGEDAPRTHARTCARAHPHVHMYARTRACVTKNARRSLRCITSPPPPPSPARNKTQTQKHAKAVLSIVQFWKDWQETEQRRLVSEAAEAEDSPAGSDPDTGVAMESDSDGL